MAKKKTKKLRTDGWENVVTGLGRSRDKRMHTYIAATLVQGSRTEFDDWYHGDHTAAKIARLPAREMTREWIKLQVDDSVDGEATEDKMLLGKQIAQAMDDLAVKTAFYEAILWSRVHGGAVIFLGVNDGVEDLAEPLELERVKSLDFLTVFDRWDLQIETYNTELKGGHYGEPETYLLFPQTSGSGQSMAGTVVHASRLIRFDGVVTSRYRQALNGGWADSIYTCMRETLADFGISWHAVCHLLADFAQAVLKMQGLAEAIASQESNVVIDRLTAMDMCRSVARAIPIDAESESFERVTTPMGGLPETIDRLMLRIAEAAEMPATLLFGQSPAGLQATGDADIRFFYDSIHAKQEAELRPRLDYLLDVLLASKDGPTKGRSPENWSYRFNPLWQETDKERAETRKTQAETDAIYLQEGVLDPDEVAMSRFGGDAYSTETVLDMEKRLAEPEEPPEPEPQQLIVQQPEMPMPGIVDQGTE